jgi:hypothetical protein
MQRVGATHLLLAEVSVLSLRCLGLGQNLLQRRQILRGRRLANLGHRELACRVRRRCARRKARQLTR